MSHWEARRNRRAYCAARADFRLSKAAVGSLATLSLLALGKLAVAQTGATAQPAPPGNATLQGASVILGDVAAARESARATAAVASAPKAATANPFTAMRQVIEDFDKNRAALPANSAAQGWLSLVDRYFAFLDAGGSQIAMQNQSGIVQQTAPTFQDLILALPSPDSWAQIVTEVDARPIPIFSYKPIRKGSRSEGYPRSVVFKSVRLVALRLTVHTLTHRAETQWQDFDSLRRINALVKAEKTTNKDAVDSSTMDQISASFAGLIEALLKTAPDSKRALAMITLELDLQEAANSPDQQSRFGQTGQVGVLSLPEFGAACRRAGGDGSDQESGRPDWSCSG